MKRIVVYGSKYGTTKMYADELAKRLGVEAVSYKEIMNLDSYDSIIYLGGVYASGVLGMKDTFSKIGNSDGKELFLITVGLVPSDDEKYLNTVNTRVKKMLSLDVYKNLHFYHLRGAIDYSRLDFKDKFSMKMFYLSLKRKPENERSGLVKAIIDTYNKNVSFVDFNELDKVISSMGSLD